MGKLDKTIIGKKFGKLTVLKNHKQSNTTRQTLWECQCDCGNKVWVHRPKLLSNHTSSCGCIVKTALGFSGEKIYIKYRSMISRCYYEKHASYKNYGGRGIAVCDEWKNDFTAFYKWSIENNYSDDLSIHRLDSNLDYSPDNCKWITLSENIGISNKEYPKNLIKNLYYGISPNGTYHEFGNANQFALKNNLNANGLRRVARGERDTYKGWKFGYTNKPNHLKR